MNRPTRLIAIFCLWLSAAGALTAQDFFDERYSDWPEDLKIGGQIIINHGLKDIEPARIYLRRAIRDKQIISFRGPSSDSSTGVIAKELAAATTANGAFTEVEATRPPVAILKTALETAGVVLIDDSIGRPEVVAELEREFSKFVDRGGILIVSARVGESLGECYLPPQDASDDADADRLNGISLLPDCLLHCNSLSRSMTPDQLLENLPADSATVGVVVEPATMLVLSGRKMFCFGTGKVTCCLPACTHTPARVESMVQRQLRSRRPWESLIDLTEWRRDAIDRTLEAFPPTTPRTPMVENGTLLIVGGGGLPRGLMDRFIELAGGREEARLVYVPCSESDDVGESQRMVRQWRAMGVKHATFIHTKDRRQAEQDEAFLEPLRDATGIWFGGGRQWNFADSYYGTKAHQLMKQVLVRGGVIGGSSAGASIQARYLARATPIGNTRIMAPGYERGGLGFIGGVAIDQHFTQRGRQADMTSLMATHPQLLGIGIDETTAIEVQKSRAKVSGRGRVFFYNRRIPLVEGQPDYVALPAGSVYDLAKREVVHDTTETTADE